MGLISDPEMYYMVERGLRGGVSFAKLRHAEVKSPKENILLVDVSFFSCSNVIFFPQKMIFIGQQPVWASNAKVRK